MSWRRGADPCRAFTVIEMLMVMAILLILLSLLLPVFTSARNRTRYIRWAAYSAQLRADTSGIAYYNMENQQDDDLFLRNRALGNPGSYSQRGYHLPEKVDGHFGDPSLEVTWDDPEWTRGRWRSKAGLSFDGVGRYVDASHLHNIDGKGALTLFAWIKKAPGCTGTSGWSGILQTQRPVGWMTGSGASYSADLLLNGGFGGCDGFFFRVGNGGNSYVHTGNTPVLQHDRYHLVMGVFNGAGNGNGQRGKIYLDGKRLTSVTYSGLFPGASNTLSGPLLMGKYWHASSIPEFFRGIIDEAGYFGRAFEDAEIRQMHNIGASRDR